MSRLPFQTVPVYFSVNGNSTQRTQERRRLERLERQQSQPKPYIEQRSIRSPYKSKWHMAADMVIVQMVLVRQIHPELPEFCWQGIADTLVQRGYFKTGLTAGSVNRFISLMHKTFQPEVLHLPKLYDRIAIFFHDEPVPAPKRQSTAHGCRGGGSSNPVSSTDCSESALEHKTTALQVVDRAYLAAQCDEALGIHRTQRPDIVARKRQAESLQSENSKSKKNIARLPTPTATSDLSQVDSTQQSANLEVVQVTDGQRIDNGESSQQPSTTMAQQPLDQSSQKSRSCRKRARSECPSDRPKPAKSVKLHLKHEASIPKKENRQSFEIIVKAEEADAVRRREEQARKLEERKIRGVSGTTGKLRFAKIDYKHPNKKKEKCFVFERMSELHQAARSSTVTASTVNLSTEVKKDTRKQGKHRTLKNMQDGSKSRSLQYVIKRSKKLSNDSGIRKPKKLKNPRIRQVQRELEFLLSSPSGSDGGRSNGRSVRKHLRSSRLEDLTQRVKSKKVAKKSAADENSVDIYESSRPQPDMFESVWGRVLKSRREKITIVAARAAAYAAARVAHA